MKRNGRKKKRGTQESSALFLFASDERDMEPLGSTKKHGSFTQEVQRLEHKKKMFHSRRDKKGCSTR